MAGLEDLLRSGTSAVYLPRKGAVLPLGADRPDEIFERPRKVKDSLLQVGYHLGLIPVRIHPEQDHAVDLFPVQRDSVVHSASFLFRVTFRRQEKNVE